jgi:hypothetical protein
MRFKIRVQPTLKPIGTIMQLGVKTFTPIQFSTAVSRGVPVQQIVVASLPVNIHLAIGLHVSGDNVPFQQPIRINLHP